MIYLGDTLLTPQGGGSIKILGYGSWGTHETPEPFTAPATGKTSLLIAECGTNYILNSSSYRGSFVRPVLLKGNGQISYLSHTQSSGKSFNTITVSNNTVAQTKNEYDYEEDGAGHFSYIVYEIDE